MTVNNDGTQTQIAPHNLIIRQQLMAYKQKSPPSPIIKADTNAHLAAGHPIFPGFPNRALGHLDAIKFKTCRGIQFDILLCMDF